MREPIRGAKIDSVRTSAGAASRLRARATFWPESRAQFLDKNRLRAWLPAAARERRRTRVARMRVAVEPAHARGRVGTIKTQ